MKTIGVLGGLGPMATVYFLERLTYLTQAKSDQEHNRIVMLSVPDVPDRTAYILGKSKENPYPKLREAAIRLEEMGADIIAMPCVTAHYFYNDLRGDVSIPFLNLPELVSEDLLSRSVKKVAIFETLGAREAGVLEKSIEKKSIEEVSISDEVNDGLMKIIYEQIKSGEKADLSLFELLCKEVIDMGAEEIILGCTELPLIERQIHEDDFKEKYPVLSDIMENNCLSVIDVLAKNALNFLNLHLNK